MSESSRQRMGARIRTLREAHGLSQSRFALMIGMDRTYLVSVEKGKRNLSFDNLEKIAKGLDVSLSHLFHGVDG